MKRNRKYRKSFALYVAPIKRGEYMFSNGKMTKMSKNIPAQRVEIR